MAAQATGTPLRGVLLRNTAVNWASYLVAGLTTVILTPYVVRGLGQSGYGVWVLLAQLAAYGSVLELGVQAALSKHVAHARASRDARMLSSYVSSAATFYLFVAILVMGVAAMVRPRLSVWFNLGAADPVEAGTALMILATSTGLIMLATVFTATLKGCLRFDKLGLVVIVSHVVRALGVVVALARGTGLVGLAWAGLASSVVVLVGAAWFASGELEPAKLSISKASIERLKSLLGFGLYGMVSLGGWYMAYASDPVIVGRLLEPKALAQLGLMISIAAMISGAVGAFAQSFMPVASTLQAGGGFPRLQSAYLLGTRWCLFVAVPSVAGALLWGPQLLSAWVGPDLGLPAGRLLGFLLLAHLPSLANSVGFQIGLGIGLHPHAAALSMVEGVVKVSLSLSLATRFGLAGVIAGSLAASILCSALAWPALLRARLGLTTADVATRAVIPAVWPLLPATFVGILSERVLQTTAGALALVPPILTASTYFALVMWSNREDLRSAYRWRTQSAPPPMPEGRMPQAQ